MIDIADLDVIFLSYKEPNKEHNWLDLKSKCPWAKRVDGVEGSDAAHKAAAETSQTERFILIDGDNVVDASIFDQQLDTATMPEDAVIRWQGHNIINGLKYGNGGISSWTKKFVKQMKTHENSEGDPESAIEFCFHDQYVAMKECYSTTVINHSEYQAWQAGFREGVKMSLDRGHRVKPAEFKKRIYRENLKNLLVWMSVGSDVKNGDWAIHGACYGSFLTTLMTGWDYKITKDFKSLEDMWHSVHESTKDDIQEKITDLHKDLNYHLGINASYLEPDQSKFFKWCNK
jgi:hypothetical protein